MLEGMPGDGAIAAAIVLHDPSLDVALAAAAGVVLVLIAYLLGARRGRGSLRQRLLALAARLGADDPAVDPRHIEDTLVHVERATDRAAEAVAESSSEAIRLRRALDALP